MSIVSGVMTAPGIAPLLNALRETNQTASTLTFRATNAAGLAAQSQAVARSDATERPVPEALPTPETQAREIRPSDDPRYERFVRALQTLRADPAEALLEDSRVAELVAAAEEYFLANDGIPKPVKPIRFEEPTRIMPLDVSPLEEAQREAAEGVKPEDAAPLETTQAQTSPGSEDAALLPGQSAQAEVPEGDRAPRGAEIPAAPDGRPEKAEAPADAPAPALQDNAANASPETPQAAQGLPEAPPPPPEDTAKKAA